MRRGDILRLKTNPVISAVYSSVKEIKTDAYLVGGVVRNIIAGLSIDCDYDFAISGKIKDAAERLAFIMNGTAFLLDKDIGSFRVVVKKDSSNINVDLSPFKGKDIMEDIFERDFTINAMSINIRKIFEEGRVSVIDPLNGVKDVQKRLIVHVDEDIFDRDPIRLLRAARFSAQYGFSIDHKTEIIMKSKLHLLKTSSWERIRDEFFLTIACHNASYNLKKLYALGLLQEIFHEIGDWDKLKSYDLTTHVFKTITEAEKLLCSLKKFMPECENALLSHFDKLIGNIPRAAFFKFVVFLHDVGKPAAMKIDGERLRFPGHELEGEVIARKIGKRLKLSRKTSGILCKIIRNHHRVFSMASQGRVSIRSKAHFFRVMNEDGMDLLLLSLADARATRGSDDYKLANLVRELIAFYFDVYAIKKPPPLLRGDDIMRIFNIPQGIMVGTILRKIREAEDAGLIKNKKEAVGFIREWFLDKKMLHADKKT